MTFNLTKSTQAAKFTLEKKGIPSIRAQIVTVLDVSRSAQGLFSSGQMNSAWSKVLPLGLIMDLNKQIDTYTFSSGAAMTTHITPNADETNYQDYIQKYIFNNNRVPKWSGTDYAPVLKQIVEDFGFYKKSWIGTKTLQEKSQSGEPVIVYYFSDGQSSDESDTIRLLQEMTKAKTQVYLLFIGIGPSYYFDFMNQCGEDFPNCGFWNLQDLSVFESDDVYSELLPDELCEWFKTR